MRIKEANPRKTLTVPSTCNAQNKYLIGIKKQVVEGAQRALVWAVGIISYKVVPAIHF